MIIPFYQKAESSLMFTADVLGKWACSYHEECEGIKYARYLHPTGWKLYTYWWADATEMERVFNRIGQGTLPVSDLEVANREDEEAYLRQRREEDFWEWMETEKTKVNLYPCFP